MKDVLQKLGGGQGCIAMRQSCAARGSNDQPRGLQAGLWRPFRALLELNRASSCLRVLGRLEPDPTESATLEKVFGFVTRCMHSL